MSFLKRAAVFLVLGGFMGGGLFAQVNNMGHFDGNLLNQKIDGFIKSVSTLIPSSATMGNTWSYVPGKKLWYGFGMNGSLAFRDRRDDGNISKDMKTFGADNLDLTTFPDLIPLLPGLTLDARFGFKRFDIGVTGMWLDNNSLADNYGATFLGEGSRFAYRTFGADVRVAALLEKKFIPNITVQAGYYFTYLGFGFESESEYVDIKFVNDTMLIGVQVTYEKLVPFISPFLGFKTILYKTQSAYEWQTQRPVIMNGVLNIPGVNYTSGPNDTRFYTYLQIYGGLGVSLGLPHLFTASLAYNVITNHFAVNFALRAILGN